MPHPHPHNPHPPPTPESIRKQLERGPFFDRDGSISLQQEDDGRWLVIIEALPGVMKHGATPEEAVAATVELAADVLKERFAELLSGLGRPPATLECTCREIQRVDPRRHFKGCALRKELPTAAPADAIDKLICASGTLTPAQSETFVEHMKTPPLVVATRRLLEPITLAELRRTIIDAFRPIPRAGVGVILATKEKALALKRVFREAHIDGTGILLLYPGCSFDPSNFDELLFELGTEKLPWWDEAVRPCLAGLAQPPLGFTLR